jgi:hypothetical protein
MKHVLRGLALLFFAAFCSSSLLATPLITNGDFTNCWGQTCSGWTLTDAARGSDFSFVPGVAEFGGSATGYYDTISQTLNTVSGANYILTFDLSNRIASLWGGDFRVLWDGRQVLDVSAVRSFGSTPFTIDVTGTGSDSLSFAGYQKTGWFGLRDVSLTGAAVPAPEPSTLILLLPCLGAAAVLRKRFKA